VGDVRYIGLFSGIELVKNRETKEPLVPWGGKSAEMNAIAAFLREKGLFTFFNVSVIFVVPPLCITVDQLEEGLALIEQALEIAEGR